MSEIGNMIFAYMRGQAMASNQQYAKQVYTERAIEQNKKYLSDIVKHMPNQADRDYYAALLNAERLDEADDFLKAQNPNFQLYERFPGTGGRMYSFDARRGTVAPLTEGAAPIIDPKYDMGVQGGLAESRSRNTYRKFEYPDGSYTIDTIENQRGGQPSMQGGQPSMQGGQPPMQGGQPPMPPQKINVEMPLDATPQQHAQAQKILELRTRGAIDFDAADDLLLGLGAKVTAAEPQAQPMPEQSAPQPVPLDGQSVPQSMQPQPSYPDLRPPQPRMGAYGQTSSNKAEIELKKYRDKKEVDLLAKEEELKRTKERASKPLLQTIGTIDGLFNELDNIDAIPNYEKSWEKGVSMSVESSPVGQAVSKYVGSGRQKRAQAIRDEILAQVPLIRQHIMSVTGMTSKQVDSVEEMKNLNKAVASVDTDIHTVKGILNGIKEKYLGSQESNATTNDRYPKEPNFNGMDGRVQELLKLNGVE